MPLKEWHKPRVPQPAFAKTISQGSLESLLQSAEELLYDEMSVSVSGLSTSALHILGRPDYRDKQTWAEGVK